MHDADDAIPARTTWLIRSLAAVVLIVAGSLLYMKLTGRITSLVGCGGRSGCAQVLGGRWSAWLHVPVSAGAVLLYALVLLATLPALARRAPGAARSFLDFAAATAGLCAIWFTAVLVLVEKTFCAYCAATHLAGLAFAAVVLVPALRGGTIRRELRALSGGVLAVAVLALGQLFGPAPDTHRLSSGGFDRAGAEPAADAPGTDRVASFFGGQVSVRVADVPRLGDPEAEHVIVEMFDYTCRTCRTAHGHVKSLHARHPDDVVVLLLPCPLEAQCNRFYRGDPDEHQGACTLARFALGVWRAAPDKYLEYHDYLMQLPLPASLNSAHERAARLVGRRAFQDALDDPWIDARIEETTKYFGALERESPVMPKMFLRGDDYLTGAAADAPTFVSLVERFFGLTPERR